MTFKIINTDIFLNGKYLPENSVVELTDEQYQKEKKFFGNFLIPFFDDTKTEKPIEINSDKKRKIKKWILYST